LAKFRVLWEIERVEVIVKFGGKSLLQWDKSSKTTIVNRFSIETLEVPIIVVITIFQTDKSIHLVKT